MSALSNYTSTCPTKNSVIISALLSVIYSHTQALILFWDTNELCIYFVAVNTCHCCFINQSFKTSDTLFQKSLIVFSTSIFNSNKVCASKSVYLYKSPYSLKVYKFACAHFMLIIYYMQDGMVSNPKLCSHFVQWFPATNNSVENSPLYHGIEHTWTFFLCILSRLNVN